MKERIFQSKVKQFSWSEETFSDPMFGDCTFQIIMLKLGFSEENIFGWKSIKWRTKIETQINNYEQNRKQGPGSGHRVSIRRSMNNKNWAEWIVPVNKCLNVTNSNSFQRASNCKVKARKFFRLLFSDGWLDFLVSLGFWSIIYIAETTSLDLTLRSEALSQTIENIQSVHCTCIWCCCIGNQVAFQKN